MWEKVRNFGALALAVCLGLFVQAQSALAVGFSDSIDFTAIETDVTAGGTKILALVLVLAGIAIVIRMVRRNAK